MTENFEFPGNILKNITHRLSRSIGERRKIDIAIKTFNLIILKRKEKVS